MTPAERAAWLARRRTGLGGSDIGAIFGVSRWAGPWDVWAEKRGLVTNDTDDASRETGRLLEDAVGRYAAKRLQADRLMRGPEAVHATLPWARASTDFLLHRGDRIEPLEAKTAEYPDRDGWGPDLSAEVPESYNLQIRWYLAVLDKPVGWVACFFKRADAWRVYQITRDAEQEADMLARAGQWWQRHVVEGNPPKLDPSQACARALAQAHPRHGGRLRIATEAEEHAARLYEQLDGRIAQLTTKRNHLRNHLRDLVGDDEGVRFRGGHVRWHRPSNRLTVRIRE